MALVLFVLLCRCVCAPLKREGEGRQEKKTENKRESRPRVLFLLGCFTINARPISYSLVAIGWHSRAEMCHPKSNLSQDAHASEVCHLKSNLSQDAHASLQQEFKSPECFAAG